MKKSIDIKVNIPEKLIEIGGLLSIRRLSNRLIEAEVSELPKEVGNKVLELKYDYKYPGYIFNEYNKIQDIIDKRNLNEILDAYPCPGGITDSNGIDRPGVAITGKFEAHIYK